MSSKPRKQHIKTLEEQKTKWYARLKRDGFKDIEDSEGRLDQYASSALTHNYRDPIIFEAKERYYQLAGQFLHTYKFNSRLEKFMWEQHCSGVSILNIVKEIRHRGLSTYRDEVHKTLQRLTKKMLERTRDLDE